MPRFGYFLASEEHSPAELVRQARLAEEAGFEALWISDHFHPWLDEQGESSHVWSVIGALSQATSLPVTTAVSCPLIRQHPALVAQAAATSSLLTRGGFTLGLGTGEALNEHILGSNWPGAEQRLEMLEEAVEVIRELFSGRLITHRGRHYTVETARLYSRPDQPPPVYLSAFGQKAIRLAARVADGYICVQPNADFVRLYRESGGGDRPVQGGLKVCWGPDAGQARKTMHRLWASDHLPGEAAQLLPMPRQFGQLAQLVTEDMITTPCGPDPGDHLAGVRAYLDAGFDEVYIGQAGPDQEGFFEFYSRQVLPRLRETTG
ncbi:MAG: TIGR03557 family F420-dependent LLM class oxidoreductase [Actinobacteria bacterium]|nr:TIGR03557 family F420-dependent LLM class oxidoreductase [Actinomycetota bacterium]MBO0788988.1 TIGR03557 family F420-dependent LLM class oxidoreductase [Actinomycetota bacterium]MBO0815267.1 TIGR03557 family F420-dependent LLM class oxidoreductase [Actinomycetota bacterium]